MKFILPQSLRNGLVLGLMLSLAIAVVAWAGFTGPNRTTTATVRQPDDDQWFCTKSGVPWTCYFARAGDGGQRCDGSPPSTGSQSSVCGWVADNCGCNWGYTEQTVSLPAASVSGSASCDQPGNNGWCRGGAAINLSANEPLSGEVIEVIEGNPGGVLCDPPDGAGVSCSWTGGGQGSFSIDFWAVSSYGDTSDMDSATWKLDSGPPTVSLSASGGSAGGGGWYRGGPIDISVSGADGLSGLESAQLSVDGGAWSGSAQVSSDGVYDVSARAIDRAGNQASDSTVVKIDGSPPNLSTEVSGTLGNAGWYLGPVTVNASASDGLSGIEGVEVSIDGGAWQDAPQTIAADGTHELRARARDVAGNEATDGGPTIKIDGSPPNLSTDINGTLGNAGWYLGAVTVSVSASDGLSGVAEVEVSIDGGAWRAAPQIIEADGSHELRSKARDVAGNEATDGGPTIKIDAHPPESVFIDPPNSSETWVSGVVDLVGTSIDFASGVQAVEISFDAGESWQLLELRGLDWSASWDTSQIPSGRYTVLARARDLAGHLESTAQVTLLVDNMPPVVDIPDSWPVLETGALTVEEGGIGLAGVTVEILDGGDAIITREYAPGEVPESIAWDGVKPDGSEATEGRYPVRVVAWDLAGNSGSDSGFVIVPQPALIEFDAPVALLESLVAPRSEVAPPTSVRTAPAVDPAAFGVWLWPTLAWLGLVGAIALAKITDPRPRALGDLRRDMDIVRKLLEE